MHPCLVHIRTVRIMQRCTAAFAGPRRLQINNFSSIMQYLSWICSEQLNVFLTIWLQYLCYVVLAIYSAPMVCAGRTDLLQRCTDASACPTLQINHLSCFLHTSASNVSPREYIAGRVYLIFPLRAIWNSCEDLYFLWEPFETAVRMDSYSAKMHCLPKIADLSYFLL